MTTVFGKVRLFIIFTIITFQLTSTQTSYASPKKKHSNPRVYESIKKGKHTLLAKKVKKRKIKRKKRQNRSSTYDISNSNLIGVTVNAGMLYLGVGYGAEIYTPYIPSLHIGIGYFMVNDKLENKKDEDLDLQEVMDVKLKLLTFNMRYFFTDSLYISGMLSSISTDGDYGFKGLTEETKDSYMPFTAKTTVASIGIGAQWHFRTKHTFGFDIIGVGKIISNKFSMGEDTPNEDGGTVRSRMQFISEDEPKDRLKSLYESNIQIHYLLFRVGYQI